MKETTLVETRLLRSAKRLVEISCPDCHHVKKIYDNSHRGIVHCMYCGAEFEWEENSPIITNSHTDIEDWNALLTNYLAVPR
jgi:ribosomal protein S27E